MTGLWTRIMNDAITKRAKLIGFVNIPKALHNMYFKNHSRTVREDIENHIVDNNLEPNPETEYDDIDPVKNNYETYYSNDHNLNYNQNLQQQSVVKNSSASRYRGGVVLEPQRGLYKDVHVFDVTSLYPTMISKYNLSPETINCSCCRNNPEKKLQISEINNGFVHISENGNHWICQERQGLFPKLLQQLREQRVKCKNSGLETESLAIKSIINSGRWEQVGRVHLI